MVVVEAARPHALIVNPSSGQGRSKKLLPEAEAALAGRGIRFRTIPTHSLEHGVEQALAAAEAGELPVVMSGDGMIGAIGGALAESETPLGVIPGGRGNDFARMLGIPTEIPEAVRVLAEANERVIDVGEANGERFLCIASTGFDSVCNRRANEVRIIRGGLVYAYAALRTLATWRPASFTVTVDGEPARAQGVLGRGREHALLRRRDEDRARRRARQRRARPGHDRRGRQAALPG